ncbi:MAG TPA: anion transporter [Tepidisphaeraceae bacterium]|jgi:Na+/H+ antiporter NhaD/arsenite permease-like protein
MDLSLQHDLTWAVFAFTYVGLALGKYPWLPLDRTGIAVVGGVGMLLVGALDVHQAAHSIDAITMLLLFGLMVFSAQLHEACFYDAVGEKLTHLAKKPKTLLACLIGVSALLSAVLANDIVCLAFTPLLCAALLRGGRDPIPYLLALATGSNIGSAATLIGNPQNMYIGSTSDLLFGAYLIKMILPVLVGLGTCYLIIALVYRGSLAKKNESKVVDKPEACKPDWPVIIKTLVLLAGLITFFLLARGARASEHRAVAALVGAGILLFSQRSKAEKLYTLVDYELILLFLGLFLVNGAMNIQHLTDQIFAFIQHLHIDLNKPPMLSGVAAVLSNIVSNVPAVLLLSPAIHSKQSWELLALISTFAGNLTLVGSIANLIVAEGARKAGVKISLGTYCLVGVPLTIVTVTVGTLWVMWA